MVCNTNHTVGILPLFYFRYIAIHIQTAQSNRGTPGQSSGTVLQKHLHIVTFDINSATSDHGQINIHQPKVKNHTSCTFHFVAWVRWTLPLWTGHNLAQTIQQDTMYSPTLLLLLHSYTHSDSTVKQRTPGQSVLQNISTFEINSVTSDHDQLITN